MSDLENPNLISHYDPTPLLTSLGIDPLSVNFEVSFVTPAEIHALNREWRGKDKPTDVLSFPTIDLNPGQIPTRALFPLDFNPETNKIELGDIVVNEMEPRETWPFLIEHGLLHLLGHHHPE